MESHGKIENVPNHQPAIDSWFSLPSQPRLVRRTETPDHFGHVQRQLSGDKDHLSRGPEERGLAEMGYPEIIHFSQ